MLGISEYIQTILLQKLSAVEKDRLVRVAAVKYEAEEVLWRKGLDPKCHKELCDRVERRLLSYYQNLFDDKIRIIKNLML